MPYPIVQVDSAHSSEHTQGLCHNRADREPGIQRRRGVLEDDADPLPHFPDLSAPGSTQFDASDRYATGRDRNQSDGTTPYGGLPAARLADQRGELAGMNLQAHVVDCSEPTSQTKSKLHDEVLHV